MPIQISLSLFASVQLCQWVSGWYDHHLGSVHSAGDEKAECRVWRCRWWQSLLSQYPGPSLCSRGDQSCLDSLSLFLSLRSSLCLSLSLTLFIPLSLPPLASLSLSLSVCVLDSISVSIPLSLSSFSFSFSLSLSLHLFLSLFFFHLFLIL